MIEQSFESVDYSCRFGSAVAPITVSFSLSKNKLLDTKMIAMKYTTLIALARDVVVKDSDSSNPQNTAANFVSAVRSWLTFIGKDEHQHNVGAELNSSFESVLAEYLNELVVAGLSVSTVRDRKSAIRRLHTIYQTQLSIVRNERSSELGTELRRILIKASLSPLELSRQTNVSLSFIKRTLGGAKPQKEAGLTNFRRIESFFLSSRVITTKGHFLDLLKNNVSRKVDQPKDTILDLLSIEEANSFFVNKSSSPLRLWSLEELKKNTPSLFRFLENYLAYKNQEKTWTLKTPSKKELFSPLLWVFKHNGRVVYSPTFSRFLSEFSRFLSFIKDYLNWSFSCLDNPMIFSDKSLYIAYIEFLAQRRGGKVAGAGLSVVKLASELPKELTRQVKAGFFVAQIDEGRVGEIHPAVKQYFKRFANSGRVRDPWKRLAPFLELADPARPLAELSNRLFEAAMVPQTFVAHSIDLRDSFLIAFLLALPIRERTCSHVTYKEDNSGHLRFSKKDQLWRIELPANEVKNQRSISRALPAFMNPIIERYLSEARPRLLNTWGEHAEDIGFLFVSAYRKCKSMMVNDEITGELYELTKGQMAISSRLAVITKKGLGMAIRSHAFRHITATRFLKLNPGQYQACADLLADSVETVMKHYAYHDPSWNEKMLNDSISKAFAHEMS